MKKENKFDFSRDANVLLLDLEVSPRKVWTYDMYDATVIEEIQRPVLLSFSWKWLGDRGKAKGVSLFDFSQKERIDDEGISRKLWELLDKAKLVVGHNVKRFDSKMASYFFLVNGLKPTSPYKMEDTLITAKSKFRCGKNNLDYLGKLLVGEGKTEITHKDCWKKMLEGSDKEAKKYAKLMKIYCNQDVDLLEKLYLKLRPWSTSHPNMALLCGRPTVCPKCGCARGFKIKAYRYTGAQVNGVQYECLNCHSYVTRRLEKEERAELDNKGELRSTFRNLPA